MQDVKCENSPGRSFVAAGPAAVASAQSMKVKRSRDSQFQKISGYPSLPSIITLFKEHYFLFSNNDKTCCLMMLKFENERYVTFTNGNLYFTFEFNEENRQ